jgi:isopenicillin N synthase-like dioxygenase
MSNSIPVLDLKPFFTGAQQERKQVARKLDEVYRRIGFVTIVGHGVSTSLIADMQRVTREFFAQNEAEKQRVISRVRDGQFCGYVPFGADAAARTYRGAASPPDLRSRYRMVKPTCSAVLEKVGPNQWPRTPADFRDVWSAYCETMEHLGNQLMRLCAMALDLPETFFAPYYSEHFSVLMASESPASARPSEAKQLRCGEHTDNGTLTIVHQSDAPGCLEVLGVNGEWLEVPPRPNAFVVNIGDLLARWTNDRWVSTVHRVGNPPADHTSAQPRNSIVFFHQPALDVEIRCLETCVVADAGPRYSSITLREHFSRQQQKLATQDASTAGAET